MKQFLFILFLSLLSPLASAQTKGFISLDAKITESEVQSDMQVSAIRCEEFREGRPSAATCLKWTGATPLSFNRVEPLEPGFYQLLGTPLGSPNLVRISLGKLTRVRVQTFSLNELGKLIPNFAFYIPSSPGGTAWHFEIARDFSDPEDRLALEMGQRQYLDETLAKPLNADDSASSTCGRSQVVREAIEAKRALLCLEGRRKTVPVEITPEAQRLLDLANLDLKDGFGFTELSPDGVARVSGIYLNYQTSNSSLPYPGSITKIEVRASTVGLQTTHGLTGYFKATDLDKKAAALLPGKYVVLITSSVLGDREIKDWMKFQVQ
jgi:hypothetical protein